MFHYTHQTLWIFNPLFLLDQGGWTALIRASYNGNNECVKLLLDSGADVNIVDNVCIANMFNRGIYKHIYVKYNFLLYLDYISLVTDL